jgi:hypothetical protein
MGVEVGAERPMCKHFEATETRPFHENPTKTFSSGPNRATLTGTRNFHPMPPPQKGYKTINHRDVQYRWIMQNRKGVNELRVEASAPVNGQVLIAELPRIVSYDMVTEAIDFANGNGWKPNESGPDFRCKHQRRGFQMAD